MSHAQYTWSSLIFHLKKSLQGKTISIEEGKKEGIDEILNIEEQNLPVTDP